MLGNSLFRFCLHDYVCQLLLFCFGLQIVLPESWTVSSRVPRRDIKFTNRKNSGPCHFQLTGSVPLDCNKCDMFSQKLSELPFVEHDLSQCYLNYNILWVTFQLDLATFILY